MINTITLNPAIDHIFYLNRLQRNITNRLTDTAVSIGGKGTHVSVNLSILGTASRAFGFSFGQNGEQILKMLRQDRIEVHFIHGIGKESRDNYLLVEEDTRDCTLIVQQGPLPDQQQLADFFDLLIDKIRPGDDLVLSGDVSNFLGHDIYGEVLDMLADKRLRVFLDASGPSLQAVSQRAPFFIKPNLDELTSLTGDRPTSDADVVRAILRLDPLNIRIIAVSLGGNGSIVRAGDTLYKVTPPQVNVYNTVGCGDCYVAGLVHSLQHHDNYEDALRVATAVSAAKAESPLSVGFDKARAEELISQVTIQRL